MRSTIKLVSLGITLVIFIILDIYWFIVNPSGDPMDVTDPSYYIVLIIVLSSIFVIGIIFFVKSRQKAKIKF